LAPPFAFVPPRPRDGAPAWEAESHQEPPKEPQKEPQNQLRLFPGAAARPLGPVSRFFPGDEGVPASRARPSEVPFLQLHNGFILFGVESGLMIVNQQAAHERVLYEKAMEEMKQSGRGSSHP
jgi:DNA mismatch repair ATPase MutL